MAVELTKPALIVVDMQNAFFSEDCSMSKAGFNISPMKSIVQNVAKLINEARKYGIPIIYTRQIFRKDFADAGSIAENWPHIKETNALVEGSRDAQIIDEVRPLDEDFVVNKHRFSAFYNTDLEVILRCLKICTVIVVGVTTNVCVESTVRDAYFRDFKVVVVSDCTAEFEKSCHEASLKSISVTFGKVVSMDELLKSMVNS
jgi:ureidoacrylate peracid hydrolase